MHWSAEDVRHVGVVDRDGNDLKASGLGIRRNRERRTANRFWLDANNRDAVHVREHGRNLRGALRQSRQPGLIVIC